MFAVLNLVINRTLCLIHTDSKTDVKHSLLKLIPTKTSGMHISFFKKDKDQVQSCISIYSANTTNMYFKYNAETIPNSLGQNYSGKSVRSLKMVFSRLILTAVKQLWKSRVSNRVVFNRGTS